VARGDMRRAINSLQVAASISNRIDADTVYRVASVARPELAKALLETALRGDFLKAREMLDKMFIEEGLSGEDIIKGLHGAIFDVSLHERKKAEIIDRMGEVEFRIVEGSNERIQLEALLAYLASIEK